MKYTFKNSFAAVLIALALSTQVSAMEGEKPSTPPASPRASDLTSPTVFQKELLPTPTSHQYKPSKEKLSCKEVRNYLKERGEALIAWILNNPGKCTGALAIADVFYGCTHVTKEEWKKTQLSALPGLIASKMMSAKVCRGVRKLVA